jgi:hypothetical protein
MATGFEAKANNSALKTTANAKSFGLEAKAMSSRTPSLENVNMNHSGTVECKLVRVVRQLK